MAMRANKIQSVKADAIVELKDKIGASKDFIFAEYRGLTVKQISALRRLLRAKNAEFHVVKNNFARIAFEELGFPKAVEPVLLGPTAVAFATADPNEVAKILVDFAKESPALKVKGAIVDKDFLDQKQVDAFSRLPGKRLLIAMLMSAMLGPVQKLTYLLLAIGEKKAEGQDAPAAAEAPAPAAEAPAPAAPAAEATQA
jgi:large subunit ribosomal protein L10